MKIRYEKAVRDRIPEIIKTSGSTCVVKQMDDDEFLPVLERKMMEEVEEYGVSGSVEELVDLVEIIYRVLELRGVSWEAFENKRREKAEMRLNPIQADETVVEGLHLVLLTPQPRPVSVYLGLRHVLVVAGDLATCRQSASLRGFPIECQSSRLCRIAL